MLICTLRQEVRFGRSTMYFVALLKYTILSDPHCRTSEFRPGHSNTTVVTMQISEALKAQEKRKRVTARSAVFSHPVRGGGLPVDTRHAPECKAAEPPYPPRSQAHSGHLRSGVERQRRYHVDNVLVQADWSFYSTGKGGSLSFNKTGHGEREGGRERGEGLAGREEGLWGFD